MQPRVPSHSFRFSSFNLAATSLMTLEANVGVLPRLSRTSSRTKASLLEIRMPLKYLP